MQTEAWLPLRNASETLCAVATNWMHRFPVRYDAMTGEVQLDGAELAMTADADGLTLALTGEDRAAITAAQATTETHVRRVLPGDMTVDFDWRDEP